MSPESDKDEIKSGCLFLMPNLAVIWLKDSFVLFEHQHDSQVHPARLKHLLSQ